MVAAHVLDERRPDGTLTRTSWLVGGRASALFAVLAGVSLVLLHRRTTRAGLAVRAILVALLGLALGRCRHHLAGQGGALLARQGGAVDRAPCLRDAGAVAAEHAAAQVGEQLAPAGAIPAAVARRKPMEPAGLDHLGCVAQRGQDGGAEGLQRVMHGRLPVPWPGRDRSREGWRHTGPRRSSPARRGRPAGRAAGPGTRPPGARHRPGTGPARSGAGSLQCVRS
ncbi:MAG TPA: hypothetical protein DEQ43_16030 [Nocardioides bacterium]|nr:hypothetical protein [Nocardioides sp.]